jgi:hypothetical protein
MSKAISTLRFWSLFYFFYGSPAGLGLERWPLTMDPELRKESYYSVSPIL